MDYQQLQQRLVYLAQSASVQVLNFHLVTSNHVSGLTALDQESMRKISEKVQRFLPVAHICQNKDAAYLEVVCDAALVVANKYAINKRWFYTAVQGMTSMAIVPSMYENASDPISLSYNHEILYKDNNATEDAVDAADDHAEAHDVDNAKDATQDRNDEGHEEKSTQPSSSSNQHLTGWRKSNRTFWTDSEIQDLIDLKMAGKSFEAVGSQLGRTPAATSSKWCNLCKPDSDWYKYIEKKRSEASGGLGALVEQPEESGNGNDDAIDKSDKMDVDEDAVEEVQPAAPAENTKAATKVTAPTQWPRRPWTDADIRELIRHKINGLPLMEIVPLMRRSHGSLQCQWMNLNKINGRWFNYIHEQSRAKESPERQAEAAQGATGANAAATGQSSSVSLFPSV